MPVHHLGPVQALVAPGVEQRAWDLEGPSNQHSLASLEVSSERKESMPAKPTSGNHSTRRMCDAKLNSIIPRSTTDEHVLVLCKQNDGNIYFEVRKFYTAHRSEL